MATELAAVRTSIAGIEGRLQPVESFVAGVGTTFRTAVRDGVRDAITQHAAAAPSAFANRQDVSGYTNRLIWQEVIRLRAAQLQAQGRALGGVTAREE